jgi:hypothetical protein
MRWNGTPDSSVQTLFAARTTVRRAAILTYALAGLLACCVPAVVAAQTAAPADVKEAVDTLAKKLSVLNGPQKAAIRNDPALTGALNALLNDIYAVQKATDAERAEAVAKTLNELLKTGRFSGDEREALPTGAEIKALTAALDELANRIHVNVIRATYGDHRTRRICDATAYFRAKCLNQSKCPDDAATISGATVCGYEPARLAEDRAKAAKVYFTCGRSDVQHLVLRGKAQIVCAP